MSETKHVLTILAVADVARAAAFYVTAFGWTRTVEVPVYVELALPGGMRLGVYERRGFGVNTGQVPAQILSSAGYTVLTASSGREALELCASHVGELPLVLTDVVMPHMSGPMFAAQLRRLRPSTQVLFMSGYSGDAVAQHGVLEAGTRFVEKPFSPAALTRPVREMLDAPRAHDAKRP